jgi:flagellar hook-associated protein FlgK
MLPTFFGLNTVTRALLAQQEAVNVVNQNISNVNTPGYSRQDAVFNATDAYTLVAFNRPSLAGQIGTGSTVTTINRFQDELLNSQIRFTNQSVGQYQVMDDQFTQIQAIYNDPSNVALNSAASTFFDSVHGLSNTPEDSAARQLVEQTGATLTHAISTRYSQLTTLQSDLNTKVQAIVTEINNKITQIAALNNGIAQSKAIGDNPNDLMDQRDTLVDDLSQLVDVHDVKNPDGTDTVQMNGRFLVNKDQAYALTALTDAGSSALIKPVQVFWQADVTQFQNQHTGFDPITGKNLTTNAQLVPPSSVPRALITTGSLAGALNIRDNVIQNTLIPQLNELSDSLTNTQVLSLSTRLTAGTLLSGSAASPDDFTVTVVTPQGTPGPAAVPPGPGPGQTLTFAVGATLAGNPAATVQDVMDAINSSTVAPYVHATLNAAGQLQLDTISQGTLVKVDQANGAASKDFGFSATVADGFNLVHVQGYGLNTPPQFQGGVNGLTLNTAVTVGDQIDVTGPDGQTVTVTVPPPFTTVFPPPTTTTVGALISTINAKGLSHGFQAALDGSGHLTIFSAPTHYGADGHLLGTQAQITGDNTTQAITATTALTPGDTIDMTGPLGSIPTFTAVAGDTVQTLMNAINSANVGVTASINSVGQFQLTSQGSGSTQSITVSNVTGSINTVLGLPLAGTTVTGLTQGYPPSSDITVAIGAATPTGNEAQDFFGGGAFPAPVTFNNSNQFFFQGSQQALPGLVVSPTDASAAVINFNQPPTPSPITFAITDQFGIPATFAGAQISVTGIDATTGLAVTETIPPGGNPPVAAINNTGVFTTSTVFSSISPGGITVSGVTNGEVLAWSIANNTQKDTADDVVVDSGVAANPSLIAASTAPGLAGNALNALALLNIQQQAIVTDGQTATKFGDFYSGVIEALGGAAQQTHTNRVSQEQLAQHLTNQKQSVVGVSLDEEAAHLIALQHAYQAAARAITTQDSMLDTIINGMGLVGRG